MSNMGEVIIKSTDFEIVKRTLSNHSFTQFFKVKLTRNNHTEYFKLNRLHDSEPPNKSLSIYAVLNTCYDESIEGHLIYPSPVKRFKTEQMRKMRNLYTENEIEELVNYFT